MFNVTSRSLSHRYLLLLSLCGFILSSYYYWLHWIKGKVQIWKKEKREKKEYMFQCFNEHIFQRICSICSRIPFWKHISCSNVYFRNHPFCSFYDQIWFLKLFIFPSIFLLSLLRNRRSHRTNGYDFHIVQLIHVNLTSKRMSFLCFSRSHFKNGINDGFFFFPIWMNFE